MTNIPVFSNEPAPPAEPEIQWAASWGDQVQVHDLVKVAKLGGAVRIESLRKIVKPRHPAQRGPVLEEDEEWYYGAVVSDKEGRQFHAFIQPHEPLFIAIEVPTDLRDMGGTEGDH